MTRAEIIQAIRREHLNFLMAIGGLSDDLLTNEDVIEGWSVKDMVGHVAMWMQIAKKFISEYRTEGAPKSLGLVDDAAVNAYNDKGWESRQDVPLPRALTELDAAYRDLIASVDELSDEDVSKALPPPWDEGDTLERLVAINSYGHEPEHTQQIVAWRETFEDDHDHDHEDE